MLVRDAVKDLPDSKYMGTKDVGMKQDYKKRDDTTRQAINWAEVLWECPKCQRKNMGSLSVCPRCKTERPTKDAPGRFVEEYKGFHLQDYGNSVFVAITHKGTGWAQTSAGSIQELKRKIDVAGHPNPTPPSAHGEKYGSTIYLKSKDSEINLTDISLALDAGPANYYDLIVTVARRADNPRIPKEFARKNLEPIFGVHGIPFNEREFEEAYKRFSSARMGREYEKSKDALRSGPVNPKPRLSGGFMEKYKGFNIFAYPGDFIAKSAEGKELSVVRSGEYGGLLEIKKKIDEEVG
jgi:hypothetical protein